ncbi:MAG: hypothetical protein ABEK75_08440 [Salinibacter sp.]
MNRRPRPLDLSFLFADVSQTQLGLVPLLTGLLLVATGCSSTQQVSRTRSDGYARVTEAATGETARVHLRDGRTVKLNNLYVGPTSTTGVVPGSGQKQSFSTASLQKVELVDRSSGFWQGAGIGAGVLAASGLLMGAGEDDELGSALAMISGFVLSVPGGLIGGVVGAIRGQRETYLMQAPSPEANSATATARSRVSGSPRK